MFEFKHVLMYVKRHVVNHSVLISLPRFQILKAVNIMGVSIDREISFRITCRPDQSVAYFGNLLFMHQFLSGIIKI